MGVDALVGSQLQGVSVGSYPWDSQFHSIIQKADPPYKAIDRLLCPFDTHLTAG